MKVKSPTQLRLVGLEDRSVPSVSATMFNDTLVVTSEPSSQVTPIRVDAQTELVRIFEGEKEIGAFKNVASMNIKPSAGVNLAIGLGPRTMQQLAIALANGSNTVTIKGGYANTVTIRGGSDSDHISVTALNAGVLAVDATLGTDDIVVEASTVGGMSIANVEKVSLLASAAKNATIDNRDGTMSIESTTQFAGDVLVTHRGGVFNLGGNVAGKLSYWAAARSIESASLTLTGQVGGNLSMVGTFMDDTVDLVPGSLVQGRTEIFLGEGNDQLILGGTIGLGMARQQLFADLGGGNDTVNIRDSARLMSVNNQINLGTGNDLASVSHRAYFKWLSVDAGAGKDTLVVGKPIKNLTTNGFETIM